MLKKSKFGISAVLFLLRTSLLRTYGYLAILSRLTKFGGYILSDLGRLTQFNFFRDVIAESIDQICNSVLICFLLPSMLLSFDFISAPDIFCCFPA